MLFSFLTILTLMSAALLLPSYMFAETRHALAQNKLTTLKASEGFKNDATLQNITSDINTRVGKIGTLDDSFLYSSMVVAPIALHKTASFTIQNIAIAKDKGVTTLTLSGIASNRATLLSFTTALETTAHLSDVKLPISEYVSGKDIAYSITATIK